MLTIEAARRVTKTKENCDDIPKLEIAHQNISPMWQSESQTLCQHLQLADTAKLKSAWCITKRSTG